MGTHEHSVWIRARPEDVWGTYVDPARLPEWQTGAPVIARYPWLSGPARLLLHLRPRPGNRTDHSAFR